MRLQGKIEQFKPWQAFGIVSLLSLFAFAVQGYHPYSEDGGLYVAGIEKTLDPTLFPVHPEFVLAHLRFSPFAAFVAGITHWSHLPLPWILLALDLASIWATLFAAWLLISRCAETMEAHCGAVALLACWLTVPIAGTSLVLLDPYVTARSLSTPLTLLAVAGALHASRRGWLFCGVSLTLALVHPLMAVYAAATVALLLVAKSPNPHVRRWGTGTLAALAFVAAAVVQLLAPPESPAYLLAVMTRRYWFPFRWAWYEQIGLIAPLLVLAALARGHRTPVWHAVIRAALLLAGFSLTIALIFSRTGLATHLVARLQPLRCFQIVYELLFLLLGAWVGERILRSRPWRWVVAFGFLGGIMFWGQRSIYPATEHIEIPGQASRNPYTQAFVWIRDNTPRDALFALDAHYIAAPGDDAQGFRAIAQRSVLPDYSKDGGEASITPKLAAEWAEGVAAQTALNEQSDAVRAARLQPLGTQWVVLEASTSTQWRCPYEALAVKVCHLP